MAKLFDADGNEVEAFTGDELKTKNQEAIDAYLKEHPDQSAEFKKAQDDLAAANAKIKELEEGGGDKNKGQKDRLIKERDEALNKVNEVEKNLMGEIKSLKDTFYGSTKTKILDKLSGGDAELKKKIQLEFDGFAGEAKTEDEIQQRYVKAYTIVKGTAPTPNFMDNMSGGGNRGHDVNHAAPTVETENGKAMRKALGISDEEAKKYGGEQKPA